MSRGSPGKFAGGKRALRKLFRSDHTLNRYLTPRQKKEAINTLSDHEGSRQGFSNAYKKWRHNKDDSIPNVTARMIKKRLDKYTRRDRDDARKQMTKKYSPSENFGADPRAIVNTPRDDFSTPKPHEIDANLENLGVDPRDYLDHPRDTVGMSDPGEFDASNMDLDIDVDDLEDDTDIRRAT